MAEMASLLSSNAIVACRPGIDADVAHVGDAATGTAGDELGILPDEFFNGRELLELDHRALIRKLLARDNRRVIHRDHERRNTNPLGAEHVDFAPNA